jgi:hypothetical protein
MELASPPFVAQLLFHQYPLVFGVDRDSRIEFFGIASGELLAQCLERLPRQRTDGAAETVQNIALEKSLAVVRQVFRLGGCGKSGDSLNR